MILHIRIPVKLELHQVSISTSFETCLGLGTTDNTYDEP